MKVPLDNRWNTIIHEFYAPSYEVKGSWSCLSMGIDKCTCFGYQFLILYNSKHDTDHLTSLQSSGSLCLHKSLIYLVRWSICIQHQTRVLIDIPQKRFPPSSNFVYMHHRDTYWQWLYSKGYCYVIHASQLILYIWQWMLFDHTHKQL